MIPPGVGGRFEKDSATSRGLSRPVPVEKSATRHRDAPRWPFYFSALLISLAALAPPLGRNAAGSPASTFTILHGFSKSGSAPIGSLVLDGLGNAYGTTTQGGLNDFGAVFRMKTDGTGFVLLHSFAGAPADGRKPNAGLIIDSSGYLYGTTVNGGANNDLGTVFKIKTDGSGYAVLHSF